MTIGRSGIVAVLLGVAALGFGGCATALPPAGEAAAVAPAAFAIDQDFADPDVLLVDGTYYAYATNSLVNNVQFATSADLVSWEVQDSDALPELPDWADSGKTWAPDVSAGPAGTFLLYFTAADRASGRQCIGVATATSPAGPFAAAAAPVICPVAEGGAIDASSYLDTDGSRWLLWKNDGNCCDLDTWLQLSPLTADGLTVAGDPTRLIKQTQEWEGAVVEAPVLTRADGQVVLFYSANNYGDDSYATGYATAKTLQGPYTSSADPLFSTESAGSRYLGPGGQDIVTGPGSATPDHMVLHSWDPAYVYRGMSVVELDWVDGRPVVRPAD